MKMPRPAHHVQRRKPRQTALSFRTWGYNTLREGDGGEMTVEAVDDVGTTLVNEKLPIRKAK